MNANQLSKPKVRAKSIEIDAGSFASFWEGHELSLCEDVGFNERDKPLDSDDDLEWTLSLRDKLIKEAHSLEHSPTHFPKNRYCEVCRRAK